MASKRKKINKNIEIGINIFSNIKLEIVKGFIPINEIVEYVLNKCELEHNSQNISIAQRFLDEAMKYQAKDEKYWPDLTSVDRLEKALDDISKLNILVFQNYYCCKHCADKKINIEMINYINAGSNPKGYLFYTGKDIENAMNYRMLYLHFGTINNDKNSNTILANEIIDILVKHDFDISLDNNSNSIVIHIFEWKKRIITKRMIH